ncbi:MAG: radical SAM protein [Anaerolineales bacterium]|nr:radical SAM protein [Anaerolineales bacterium]MCB9126632.1 radical SAM protein [Ardenticatenales bacterium]MCB9172742.1 radical SAM protein [Ardenticatenales bacterium]
MRVLLANPESKVWSSRKQIPLGLGYLAAVLRDNGHDITIFDAAVEDEPFGQFLDRHDFQMVGVTATTPLIYEAWKMAEAAKQRGAITILGGAHLTIMPMESMEKPFVDFVAVGEAEDTLLELVTDIETTGGTNYGAIAGLVWRDGSGTAIMNRPRVLDNKIDRFPYPAHDLFKIDRYTNLQPLTDGLDPHARSFIIMTSRGCPYKCNFCSKPVTGDTWRMRSVDDVIGEWRWLVHDLKATEIGVTDDIWNMDLTRAKELCRRLIEEGLNTVPWVTVHGMKVNHTDLELFQLMKAAGCKRVGFGVESGDEYILKKVIRKSQTLDMVREAFKNARAAGLQTMGFFIFGMPEETAETMDKTIEFALELDPELANFMIAAPFPGTRMYDLLEKHGNIFSHDWQDFAIHDQKARFQIGDLDPQLVEQKWHEAYRRFYLRPNRLAQRLMSKDTWINAPERLNDARRMFFSKKKAHGVPALGAKEGAYQ